MFNRNFFRSSKRRYFGEQFLLAAEFKEVTSEADDVDIVQTPKLGKVVCRNTVFACGRGRFGVCTAVNDTMCGVRRCQAIAAILLPMSIGNPLTHE